MAALTQEINRNGEPLGIMTTSSGNGDTIEELTREVDMLKKKLEEERAKFNDVACKTYQSYKWRGLI